MGCIARSTLISTAVAILVAFSAPGTVSAEIFRLKVVDKTIENAIALLGKGQLKDADALFEKILSQNPGQPTALLGRAQIAVSEARLADATKAVDSVLERTPNLAEAHNMKGVVLLLARRNADARQAFSKALLLRPSYITPRIYLAALTRAEGDHGRTAAEYHDLTRVAPRLSIGYIGEAEAQLMMGKPDAAFETLNRWKRADPSSVLPSHVIASVQIERGQSQQAIAELKAALKKAPKHTLTLKLLGDAHTGAGAHDEAAQYYTAALAADNRNADAAVRLGDLSLRTGNVAKAMEHLSTAIKADPNHPVACNNLAWLIADRRGNLDEALQLAERAVKNSLDYVDAHDTLGWVHYLRGEYTKAIPALQKAKALDGKRADIAAHLGLAYAKAGQNQKALAELKQALATGGPGLQKRAEIEKLVATLTARS